MYTFLHKHLSKTKMPNAQGEKIGMMLLGLHNFEVCMMLPSNAEIAHTVLYGCTQVVVMYIVYYKREASLISLGLDWVKRKFFFGMSPYGNCLIISSTWSLVMPREVMCKE